MDNYKQQVIDFFERRTAYDFESTRHPQEAARLLNFVSIEPGNAILDLATGTGLVAIAAAQKVGDFGSVMGVDFSPEMLRQARQKIRALRLNNCQLIEADVESIDFSPATFDRIFCCSAITYFVNIDRILDNCYRWLKPGGYLAFTCPSKFAYLASIQERVCQRVLNITLPHINEPLGTTDKCHHLLQQAGFGDIQLEIEESGEYLPVTNSWVNWNGGGFYPRGNPLANLTDAQLTKLQQEYQQEIAKLFTSKGIWYDRTTFFVRACKQVLPNK